MQQIKNVTTLESADICNESYFNIDKNSINGNLGDNNSDSNGGNKEGHKTFTVISYI